VEEIDETVILLANVMTKVVKPRRTIFLSFLWYTKSKSAEQPYNENRFLLPLLSFHLSVYCCSCSFNPICTMLVVIVLSLMTNCHDCFPAVLNAVLCHVLSVFLRGIAVVSLLQCCEVVFRPSLHPHANGTAQNWLLMSFFLKYLEAK